VTDRLTDHRTAILITIGKTTYQLIV